jgi:hypothetical protein
MVRLNKVVSSEECSASDTPSRPHPHSELSVVALVRDIEVDGRTFPAGARGTVVAAYADGQGYEVELFEPVHGVVTVGTKDITG